MRTEMVPNLTHPIYWLSEQGQTYAEITFGAAAVLALVYCLKIAVGEKKMWPLFVFGAAMLQPWFLEPFNNMLNYCAYPAIGDPAIDAATPWAKQHTLVHQFGRHIPVYTWFIYMFYFSAPIVALIRYFESGITMKQYWKLYAVAALACTLFEPFFIQLNWWRYYGPEQPFALGGFPFYWWFINPVCVLFTAGAYHALRKHKILTGWKEASYIILGPLFVFASWQSGGAPMAVAFDLSDDPLVINLASLLVVFISLLYAWFIGRMVTVPNEDKDAVVSRNAEYVS